MRLENIVVKDVEDIDTQFAFFHYTNTENIQSIDKNGLISKIGNSATGIELTEKIFFQLVQRAFLLSLILGFDG